VVTVEPGPWITSISADCLIRAAMAIRLCRYLRFAYRSHAGHDSHREIEPYAIIHTDGRWYLIGHCLLRNALRTFRLDRINDLETCAESFDRPAHFDARLYLREKMPFVQSDYQIDVWIDMPIEEAQRTSTPWRVVAEAAQGGTRLRCGRDHLQTFAAMVLSMERRIIVHEPVELREVFRQLARQALQAAQQPD